MIAPTRNIAFVLCRPMQAGNIGAAARALKNMGFSDLRLAAPTAPEDSRDAKTMAVHAADVLANARRYDGLSAALADRTITVGTTCRPGLYRSIAASTREAARRLIAEAKSNRIAIVFGSEDHGLTNDEIKLCHRLITIPTAEQYPSLNLAQAVMLVAYEMRLAFEELLAGRKESRVITNKAAPSLTPTTSAQVKFALAGEVQAMFERLADALVAIGFLPTDNPDHIMFALRALFGRSGLTTRELDILNGIARQMKWTVEGGAQTLAAKRAIGKKVK